MVYKRTIVYLAASAESGGFCIAGKEYKDGQSGNWIRPVSGGTGGEISKNQCKNNNGQLTKVLDVVNISFDRAAAESHQKENHIIKVNELWQYQKN